MRSTKSVVAARIAALAIATWELVRSTTLRKGQVEDPGDLLCYDDRVDLVIALADHLVTHARRSWRTRRRS